MLLSCEWSALIVKLVLSGVKHRCHVGLSSASGSHDVILYHGAPAVESEERPRVRRSLRVSERKRAPSRSSAAAACSHHERAERRAPPPPPNSGCPPVSAVPLLLLNMSVGSDFGNPLRKFKLVFLGEQSGKTRFQFSGEVQRRCRAAPRGARRKGVSWARSDRARTSY